MSAGRRGATPERVTFAVAAAIVLGLGGAIGSLWLQEREPVRLTVEVVGDVRVIDGRSYLTAQVRNAGDETAQAVQVIAELVVGGEVVADGEQSIDFLSGGEVEELVFILDQTAQAAETNLRVASYTIP